MPDLYPNHYISLIDGHFSARVGVSDRSEAQALIARDVAISRDGVDGTWTVMATHPEVRDLERADLCLFGSGSIHIEDPVIIKFMEALATLITAPDTFGIGRCLRFEGGTA